MDMKITIPAADLAAASTFACRAAAKATIDISGMLLLRTRADGGVEIIGHSPTRMHTACAPATVHLPGAAAVPAHRLTGLIDATPPDAVVTITYADGAVTVAAGRSTCRIPAPPAIEFPMVLAPKAADAVTIDLGADVAAALLGGPAELASDDEHRLHLAGVYLHRIDGKLAAAVTNGVALMGRVSTIAVPALAGGGITVPTASAKEIARLARRTGVTLVIDGRLLQAYVEGRRFAIISKLIDVSFPDYIRDVPPLATTAATFSAADMLSALARLSAASAQERPVVGMTWGGGDALSLCLVRENGVAADAITAATTGSGRVACTTAMLKKVIEVMGVTPLRLSIDTTPGATLRLDPPEQDGTLAVIAQIRWFATA
jgi:DNA polymerase III sliding clamp (beta) subunit (PCNA family)